MNWNPWKRIRELEADIPGKMCRIQNLSDEITKNRDALSAIAACETHGANATVKRMAKIAREALGE